MVPKSINVQNFIYLLSYFILQGKKAVLDGHGNIKEPEIPVHVEGPAFVFTNEELRFFRNLSKSSVFLLDCLYLINRVNLLNELVRRTQSQAERSGSTSTNGTPNSYQYRRNGNNNY